MADNELVSLIYESKLPGVAKSRRTTTTTTTASDAHGRRDRPPRAAAADSVQGRAPAWSWPLIGALWCLYLLLFLAQPLPGLGGFESDETIVRWQFLMVHANEPDFVVRSWFGSDFDRFGFADRAPIFLAAAFLVTSAASAGWLVLRRLDVTRGLSRLETWVFSTAAGLNLLSLYTLAIGLAGGLRIWGLFAAPLTLVLLLAAARFLFELLRLPLAAKKEAEQGAGGDNPSPRAWGWFDRHGIWLIAPFAVLMALGGVLPPWEFDVREYHLQAPKEWFQQGRIDFLPHNVYANMPLGAELHAIPAMALLGGEPDWWRGALAGKTIMSCFSVFTALSIYAAGRRFVSGAAGAVAALIYISTPLIGQISMQGLVECALGFYLFTALYAVLLWRGDIGENNGAHPQVAGAGTWRWLAAAGFLAGGAAAVKYTGVVFVTLPLLAWVLSMRSEPAPANQDEQTGDCVGAAPRRIRLALNWRGAAVFALAAAIGCGLWYGKNAMLAGNPVYPLAYGAFGGKSWDAEKNRRWREGHQPPANKSGWRYSLSDFYNRLKRFALTNEWLSPLVVPLAPLAFFASRRRLVWIIFGAFACVFLLWWLTTHRLDRFWLPAFPLVALLAGIGAVWRDREVWRWMAGGLLALGLAANLLVMCSRAMGDNRFFVALDDLKVDKLREDDPYSRVHPAHRYLNGAVPDGCRVLLVGEAQAFDIEADVLYNTCFDDCIFETLMQGRTADERRQALRDNRISHVFIHWMEIARYRSPGNYGFTDYVTPQVVHGELVHQQGLLRIDPDSPQNPPVYEVFEVVGAEEFCGE